MRVIAGKAKGRRLKVPKLSRSRRLRPLIDLARGALFNILGVQIEGSAFLDLFAGTGSVGIEALSRGARLAFFVEFDRKTVQTLRENLKDAGFEAQAEVYVLDVRRAIKLLNSKGAKFDFVFLGAPYDDPVLEEALELLSYSRLLRENGLAIAEHRFKHGLNENYGRLFKCRQARYGDTVLTFYQNKTPESE